MGKLSVKALAISLGATWALTFMFIGWTAMFGWGKELVAVMASRFIGFEPTFIGGIFGAIWGFVSGVIAGAIIALIYNLFVGKK